MEALIRYLNEATAELAPGVGRERYRGSLLGLAVGNALGCQVEGMTVAAIREIKPQGIRDIHPLERGRPWDDDVAQTIELGECLLEERFEPAEFRRRLVKWMEENGRGIGGLTHLVLSRARDADGEDDVARQVWEESGRQAAGNGAVMRCAPVALRWRRDPRRLLNLAQESARATHYDPRCVWTTVAISAVLARALSGADPGLTQLADALADAGAPDEVVEAAWASGAGEISGLELDDAASMGYTVLAMRVGLWSSMQSASLEEVLLAVVNAGGDTDTNCAIAGAVAGARVGAELIPERWYSRLRDPGQLTDLADRLWEAAEGHAAS